MASGADPLRVSVIVPTYNRRELLTDLLDSLVDQTLSPEGYEIIVIDDHSTDGTSEMLAERAAHSRTRLEWDRLDRNSGVAHASNVGVNKARADILAFTDSDCRVERDWLERGLAPFDDPDVAFVSGAVRDKPEQPVTFFSLRNGAGPGENFSYPTCNIFYRKSVFVELDGLDEELCLRNVGASPVACSDTDLAWRAKNRGYRNVYAEDLVVYHEVRAVPPLRWLLAHARLTIIPRLTKLHPVLREKCFWWGPFLMAENLLFYLGAIGAILAVTVHVSFAILAVPFLHRAATVPGRQWSLARVPRTLARVAALSVLHAFICACLIYGSLRARTIVL